MTEEKKTAFPAILVGATIGAMVWILICAGIGWGLGRGDMYWTATAAFMGAAFGYFNWGVTIQKHTS